MSAFEAAEMLATGKAVVTTVEDIRTLRDRAVEEATAPLRIRLVQLEKALERVRREATIAALEALPCPLGEDIGAADCIVASIPKYYCPRCRSLAEARKGGK